MRSRLGDPDLHRARAAEGRERRQGASDAEARGAAAPGAGRARPTPATWCSTRSSAPARPAPWPRCWAATSSASSARKATARSPRSGSREVRRFDSEALERHHRQAGRAAGAVRHAGRARHAAPGRGAGEPARRRTAKVRADGTLIGRRREGLDPPGRRACSKARPPATAGPTGTSSATARPSPSTCCASRSAPRWKSARTERFALSGSH